jgi:quercetin dioxygenase-like cupin family protein
VNSDSYGPTSGNEERVARHLMDGLLVFSLADEAARLRAETEWRDGDRNSVTLAKEVDFRVVLSVLGDGAKIHEDHGEARVSVQLLEGSVTLQVDGDRADMNAGELATINAGRGWRLTSHGDSTILLTFAWPREKAGI